MAKQIVAVRKLILDAGKATPAYPVGPVLGVYGINLGLFVKEYNRQTEPLAGYQVPVEVTVYADRSFAMQILQPTTASLLRRAAGVAKGAAETGHKPSGSITYEQLREIAGRKMSELNVFDLAQAEKIIAGTARSMGITILSEVKV